MGPIVVLVQVSVTTMMGIPNNLAKMKKTKIKLTGQLPLGIKVKKRILKMILASSIAVCNFSNSPPITLALR